jgi:hypothetical protein
MANFGTPLDVAELVIESRFPADPGNGAALRELATAGPPAVGTRARLDGTRPRRRR